MKKIFICGHNGLVGSALKRLFEKDEKYKVIVKSRSQLDLKNFKKLNLFFSENKPDFVILAAAKVGGILANSKYPVEFMLENIKIQNNVIELSHYYNVKKLLFLGSSCIYPKTSPQPLKEEYILSSKPESTNEAYSLAKIVGLKLCSYYNKQYGTDFCTVMPSNLYGSNDNYHRSNGHALPMLIDKIHKAKVENNKEVIVWGSGKPLREFMFSDDLARACKLLLESQLKGDIFNIGTGEEISIKELSYLIKDIVGFEGKIIFDESFPDGVKRKILDSTKFKKTVDWNPNVDLRMGIEFTYQDYINSNNLRR